MTDEEKKAIQRCNELVKPEHANWIGISNQKAIETILNLVKELQKEIEEADEIIDNSIETQHEREKYTHSLEEKIENQKVTLELYCKNYGLQKDKIEKQSKVIDMMSLSILNLDRQLEINRYKDRNDVKQKFFKHLEDGTYESLKQYFYRKVENDE